MTVVGRLRGLAITAVCALAAVLPARAEQISVTHWGVLMYGVPFAAAMDKGRFKQAGIDIDGILTSKGGGTTVRNVLAGGLPYGEVSLSAAVAAANQGLDIKIVNNGVQTAGEILWVTMPDSPIKSLKDVAGKKIAFTSPKSVTDMLLIMALDQAGMKPEAVERVAAGGIGAGLTALAQGGVVAAPIMDPVWAKDAAKYRVLFYVKDVLPKMSQTVGITTGEFIKTSPEKLKAIIAGRRAGVDWVYAHPEEAGKILAREYNLDAAVAEKSVRNMIDIQYWSPGAIDRKGMEAMVGGLRIIGEVDGPVDWAKLIDPRFLPADLQNAGS